MLFVFISLGLMYAAVESCKLYYFMLPWAEAGRIPLLLTKVIVGGFVYVGALCIFDRELLTDLRGLRNPK